MRRAAGFLSNPAPPEKVAARRVVYYSMSYTRVCARLAACRSVRTSLVLGFLLVGRTLQAYPASAQPTEPMSISPAMPMPAPRAAPPAGGMRSGHAEMHGMQMSGGAMKTNAAGLMQLHGAKREKMDMSRMAPSEMPAMTDLGVSMSREGSGTSWLPDSTTVFGHMSQHADDMFMTHGVGFVRYSDAFTPRGTRSLNAPNWYMLMDAHPLSPNVQASGRAMLTADFLTVGGFGYPELFQTGESFHGMPLHDHQHPHDLVSELSGSLSGITSPRSSVFLYAADPGEPALGPPTYMHRAIAYDMADAPIGHHWEDSTHITFGVVTLGATSNAFKLETSAFTGREPNEARTNFDPVHLDSSSFRFSWNPTRDLATQVSYGYLKSPEAATPTLDRHRTTASVLYNRPLGPGEAFSSSLVWGQNLESDGARSNAYLIEGDYHRRRQSIYARAEFVQKSGTELVLPSPLAGDTIYPIGVFTAGYVRDMPLGKTDTVYGLGGQVTMNARPPALSAVYGGYAPLSAEIFVRFRPRALGGGEE